MRAENCLLLLRRKGRPNAPFGELGLPWAVLKTKSGGEKNISLSMVIRNSQQQGDRERGGGSSINDPL